MMRRRLLIYCFSILFVTSLATAQVLPSQTDLYNISLDKLKNITKDSLKTQLIKLQQTTNDQSDLLQLLHKNLLEVSIGDQYLGLQNLENLSSRYPDNYDVWNTYAWALFIAGQPDKSLIANDKCIAIHARQLGGSDHLFRKMALSATGKLPVKEITQLKTDDYYDFLVLQTITGNSDSLLNQIHYLLYNRLVFLPQQDSITGRLLLDAGDLIAKKTDRNLGVEYYALAIKNDSSLIQAVKTRTDFIEDGKRSVKSTFNWASAIWAIPLVAMAVIGAAFMKSQKQ